jgi:NDP-sugar pyrophosphorylase family protein
MVLPKPLVPIGGRPILEHLMHTLADSGVTRVDLCVGHLGGLIQTYFSQAGTIPAAMNVDWRWEREPLGTAGALRLIPDLEGTFLVLNGDVLTTLDYRALVEFHRAQGSLLTVAMHAKRVDLDVGVIESVGGRITGYREKPSLDYDVSMGIYVFDAAILSYLPDGPCQFPELVWRLLEDGKYVSAYRSDAAWYDIGTLGEYDRAVQDVERGDNVFGL